MFVILFLPAMRDRARTLRGRWSEKAHLRSIDLRLGGELAARSFFLFAIGGQGGRLGRARFSEQRGLPMARCVK